ncbi:helix-turn-helix domain-containing protein [Bergeyella porcorum]|uniref:helix-turn-helix domain-containing protein n=1 Tax=Bergeyella porcorum TaxID=1735111 RepID=UPI0035ECC0E6
MKYKHLTLEQRYEIKAYLKCNKSQKFIAEQLGREICTKIFAINSSIENALYQANTR